MTGFRLLSFLGTLAVVAATDIKPANTKCHSPFTEISGRCVHIDVSKTGTWQNMRKFCQQLGGDLVNLSDLQFYGDILLYIESLHLPHAHLWIGATDEATEDVWMWTDGTPVRMGTPFWANFGDNNSQMPDGGDSQNCAMLDVNMHYYFNDFSCSKLDISPLCEK
ncbi:C-type lectin domain family 17, member A-like isoform X2 [Portunus trituberculatus]|uniref:C-type lectin domain family 17, member A-like isoform X2 n=1 Tax=Portunus trituberculatus TaxID=210409 RepID=UPI001E1D0996|nr:C-type lectin domain family 17, member A-like isoform X2 [Portunus trituberculatus]